MVDKGVTSAVMKGSAHHLLVNIQVIVIGTEDGFDKEL